MKFVLRNPRELESGLDLKAESGVAPALHILVVGFHHQKGCTVEYVYPPFSLSATPSSSLSSQLPAEWRHLPHLALPDGCHNYDEDASFFVLPTGVPECSNQAVYGVACCRQIDSKELKPSCEVTRSTIQKSVCVLSKYPYYGSIEAKISQVTQAYFEAKDFSNVSILQDALTSLNSSLFLSRSMLNTLHVGLAQQTQVMKFGHRLLQIFKALLLQKRVLLCGLPTKDVCKAILSILSLFPRCTEALVRPEQKTDEFGFPLQVFVSPFNVQPYMCLQQMDALMGDNSYLLVGVTNPLFQKQHSKLCDLYVSLDDGQIDISDPTLRKTLYLTSADLRFCDFVLRSVQDVRATMTNAQISCCWFGSNEWVKSQYRLYLVSLLATSLGSNKENLQEFGGNFMESWLKGFVYTNWKLSSKKYTGMSKVEPIHLCHGDLTFNDVKLRLSAQATEYGLSERSKETVGEVLRHTRGVVSSVGGAVGGAWSAASSAVSSWWWSGEEDVD